MKINVAKPILGAFLFATVIMVFSSCFVYRRPYDEERYHQRHHHRHVEPFAPYRY